ncbi:uncharacterized protein LOC125206164 [Salvia hispanica]|uniref:uncharacterized protein LOC125206164 n=1 Tax=Salvia hispanica TaxID=49212 RepID=UPI002009CFF4|nr:uncharacterized protein LOC125206164 [Salvia hispanica]
MGSGTLYMCSKISGIFKKKKKKPLPIETPFVLPSALPSWPAGEGFATGTIDLGGLQIREVSTFAKIWAAKEGGPDNLGAAFFEPNAIPDGFFMLGSYSQPNNKPLSASVLVAAATSAAVLKPPTDYTLVWSSEGLKINQDGAAYIWLPTPPDGYRAVGSVVTSSPAKPALDKIRCVRADLTDSVEREDWIWGNSSGFSVYTSRPKNRGREGLGVPTNTFLALKNGSDFGVVCLKNAAAAANVKKEDDSDEIKVTAMPDSDQIKALIETYSPRIYFHPDEQYLPSSVTWFFQNGALLYTKGEESKPVPIDAAGSNLPQGGGNDGLYWIDLPADNAARERVKKGDLSTANAYIHVKPMFGGTFTDLVFWIFYPFNGAAKAKVEFLNIGLGKIGEHVGDWEHVTLRISNMDGELKRMYFAQHSKGEWVDASGLEFADGNRPVAYASLHGHAAYHKAGLVLSGNGSVGIRNDSGKGKMFMDCGVRYEVISDGEPGWVEYRREWGPKISYSFDDEVRKVEKVLPGKLKSAFDKAVRSLPNEVLGEEGPTGPKGKDSWLGDERS